MNPLPARERRSPTSPLLDRERLARHRLVNFVQSLLLLGGMFALLLLVGWLLAGGGGLAVASAAGVVLLVFGSSVNPGWVLRAYRAAPIDPSDAPDLYRLVSLLSERAGLRRRPSLYWIPTRVVNAFTVGRVGDSAIALTDGLLRSLSRRQLTAVIAHEIGHVRNRDLSVMRVADVVSRTTSHLSLFGQVLLLVNLPLLVTGQLVLPWTPLLLLVAAPTVSSLLQLALSRRRELDADLAAVTLTGDPDGLASALRRMESPERGWLGRLLLPNRHESAPSYLRTHPQTAERVQRLRSLVPERMVPMGDLLRRDSWSGAPRGLPSVGRTPRWHVGGLWY